MNNLTMHGLHDVKGDNTKFLDDFVNKLSFVTIHVLIKIEGSVEMGWKYKFPSEIYIKKRRYISKHQNMQS